MSHKHTYTQGHSTNRHEPLAFKRASHEARKKLSTAPPLAVRLLTASFVPLEPLRPVVLRQRGQLAASPPMWHMLREQKSRRLVLAVKPTRIRGIEGSSQASMGQCAWPKCCCNDTLEFDIPKVPRYLMLRSRRSLF